MRKIIFGNRFRYFFSRNQFAASLWWARGTQPSPIIMMNLDILESDKAQSVPKLVSALWLCVTNGEAAAAACDIVSRDPDRGCVWHSPRCDVKMCNVAAPPSPVFSTQFTLPPQMGEYDTVGAGPGLGYSRCTGGILKGVIALLGTVLAIPLNLRSCI